jgi:8-oxo-dGTP diphosphatase
MAREQLMAAGGIVLRREQPPRIAVVRLRKRDEWVLPKGKLDDGETPRDAAKREVLEETGHNVTVHEFLGTLVLDTGTRSKIVHYWRMEASGEQTHPLMDDVRAVDWLPLDEAVERLSRSHEKAFLETVGPYALAGLIRRTKAKAAEEEKAVPAAKPSAASKPAAAEKFAPAPSIRAAAARAAAAGKLIPKEPGVKEAAKETVASKPAKEAVAAKPVATRTRRSRASEPKETVAVPEPMEVPVETTPAAPAPVEATPVEHAPVVAETVEPSQMDLTPASSEKAPEHDTADARTDGDVDTPEEAVAASSAGIASDVTEPVQPEREPAAEELPEEVLPADHSDVERVQAVAAKIKSMTTEAVSRIAIDQEQDKAPQNGATEADEAPELTASEASTPEPRDPVAAHAAGDDAGPTEPPRQTLAQKVRGWFGRAA